MTKPPVTGATHTLPFDKLSPRDFERLSLWLVEREGYERAEHLGAAGNEQGRDLIAWLEGQQWAFQCKRVKSFGPADTEREVDKLKKLPKEERPFGLIFIVTCDVSAGARKRARKHCVEIGLKKCLFWADTELDQKVKLYPEIVEEFFQVSAPPAPPEDLFTVPFIRNPDFVGRQEDLERLHQALHGETPVGIRPAGLTGMGGIGKTQLAVEYAYRYRDGYPGGVLWINAAEPLPRGFAALGRRLYPATANRSQEEQIRAAGSYLQRHDDALLVFDNLADPTALNRQVAGDVIPAALPCRVLFSTRRRDLGRFTPVEVTVLPEDAALQLLLRHPDRQAARDPAHAEHDQARAVCRLLGRLPLALEVAGAFLGEWPEVPLADFRARLRQEGALATLDEEAEELPLASLPLIHDAAVAATLQTQWDALADKDACLLIRVAGQLPEAAQIPVARLGLLAGISDVGRPGRPSRLARSLKRLERASLVEELQGTQVRLHPLVREFAARQTPEEETLQFRARCAANLADAYDQFVVLQDHCARRGIDALQWDLLTALDLLSTKLQDSMEDTMSKLQGVLRLLQREAHNLRGWTPGQRAGYFAQQALYRAHALNLARLATGAATHLAERAIPFLNPQWRASSESPALERILTGHEDWVLAVAVTSDGRRAVSASSDRTLRVWDLDSGEELAVLLCHEDWVNAVAVTPDGRRVVSVSEHGTLRVWDLDTREELAYGVNAVAVTPDGRRAVLASEDGRALRVWDFDTREKQVDLRWWVCAYGVNAVAVTPDGRRAVLASEDSTVWVWDLAIGRVLATLRGHEGAVSVVAVAPDGRRAVSASADRTLRVWDLDTREELTVLQGPQAWVRAVEVTPGGRRVVSACEDSTVRVWNLATGEELAVLRGHEAWVNDVAVSPDGRRAISASNDGTLHVWDLITACALDRGEELAVLRGHEARVNAVTVGLDGRRAVSASYDRTLRVWDLASGEQVAVLRGHESSVSAVAVTPDGRRTVSASSDEMLRVWDLESGEELAALRGHEARVNAVVVSPDGRFVVSASDDRTVRVWDLEVGEELAALWGHEYGVNAIAVTSDGRRAVSASYDGILRVWDLARACAEGVGQELAVLWGHETTVNAVVVTPDGRCVTASGDLILRVWDLARGVELEELRGHEAGVNAVVVSPDGRRAVSASEDRTVRVWALDTGQELAVLRGHEGGVTAVAMTPDGRRAVSVSDDRTVRVWDLESGKELATVALDGALWCVSVAQDGATIVTGDRAGNVYCLRYVEPPVTE